MSTVHGVIKTPLGEVTLIAHDESLAAVHFAGGRHRREEFGERAEMPLFTEVERQFAEYFERRRTEFELPLAPRGEPFQLRVWELLKEIPYGETRTYGELARRLGDVNYSQAVGAANGQNPLSVIVPCHRVIGADGSLTGYAGGLDRKRYLLALEEPSAVEAGRLF
ncbi:methylated-DNA--[protein]-cysteine S-methyltransferase [Saccharopolyspora gloriosae]|uniref:methylated-DNA--[protein]-cysteine S-methyltransferase n=1 Tax=Saccharopolyspora gloriosae TaxID=455344 RepID=UPI001FB61D9D|nr:methylated-DNA--[protein]-cysteine S-methyltransferase [Saccharopolyspora gloriosae]